MTSCVASFPAGAVGGMALSQQAHLALGASRDGHLRVMDYRWAYVRGNGAGLDTTLQLSHAHWTVCLATRLQGQ